MSRSHDDPETRSPTGTEPPVTALQLFLKDSKVKCPSCGYLLRDLTGRSCPECGCGLRLKLEAETHGRGALFAGIVILSLGLGIIVVPFIVLMIAQANGGNDFTVFIFTASASIVVLSMILCGWINGATKFMIDLTSAQQKWRVVGCVALVALAIFLNLVAILYS